MTTIIGDGYTITLTQAAAGTGALSSDLQSDDSGTEYRAAIHGLEALILAHFVAGVDVTHPAYVCGVNDAITAINNHF